MEVVVEMEKVVEVEMEKVMEVEVEMEVVVLILCMGARS